jgi:hypothetical protein
MKPLKPTVAELLEDENYALRAEVERLRADFESSRTACRMFEQACRDWEARALKAEAALGEQGKGNIDDAIAWCVFCKKEHAGGKTCMGHYP